MLTAGSRDDKVRAAFELFDADSDGFITYNEMVAYLTSVFRVVLHTNAAARASVNMSPEELARHTADGCFAEADTDRVTRGQKAAFVATVRWCLTLGCHLSCCSYCCCCCRMAA